MNEIRRVLKAVLNSSNKQALKRTPSQWYQDNSPLVLTRRETLQYVERKKISTARFGDGELILLNEKRSIPFQPWSSKLHEKLLEALTTHDHRLLVCTNTMFARHDRVFQVDQWRRTCKNADAFLSINGPNDVNILERRWQRDFYERNLSRLAEHFENRVVGDATYLWLDLYIDEYIEDSLAEVVHELKHTWMGKDIICVAPSTPLMAPSFQQLTKSLISSGAKSFHVIRCPEIDAFSRYHEIKAEVMRAHEKAPQSEIWVQMGPAASVLCFELATHYGLRAIDIGSFNVHISKILAGIEGTS